MKKLSAKDKVMQEIEKSLCKDCIKIETCEKHNLPNYCCWYRKCEEHQRKKDEE